MFVSAGGFRGGGRRRWSPTLQFLQPCHQHVVALMLDAIQLKIASILFQGGLDVTESLLGISQALARLVSNKLALLQN